MAEAHPSTATEQTTEVETEGESRRPPLSHSVPPPQNMNRSKLDWLLQINEDYFEDQLRTVVSNIFNSDLTPFLLYCFYLHSEQGIVVGYIIFIFNCCFDS